MPANAQTQDSTVLTNPYDKVRLSGFEDVLSGKETWKCPDTSLEYFHQFDPTQRGNLWWQRAGAFGQPTKSISFQMPAYRWFDAGIHQFDPFIYSLKNLPVAQARVPYTSLSGMIGGASAVKINGILTRNINSRLNVLLGLSKMGTANTSSANGLFQRQQSDHGSYFLTSTYYTKNGRYSFMLASIISKSKVQLNGGINIDPAVFDGSGLANAVGVNLQAAQTIQKRNEMHLFQRFHLGRYMQIGDSAKRDTFVRNGWEVVFNTHLQKETYSYRDPLPDSVYYNKAGLTTIADTASVGFWRNEIGFEKSIKNIKASLLIIEQTGIGKQKLSSVELFQTGVQAAVDYSIKNINTYNLNGKWITTGFNAGDYEIRMLANSFFASHWQVSAFASLREISPTWLERGFQGEAFQFNTPVIKQKISDVQIAIRYKTIAGMEGYYGKAASLAVWDSNGVFNAPATLFSIRFFYQTIRPQGFNVAGRYEWQHSSTANVPVPTYLLFQSIWFATRVRHVLPVRLGVEVRYSSRYFALAYLPEVGQFGIQSTYSVGKYPFFDFYASAFLKKARFFVKLENAMQGWPKKYAYTSPLYPLQGRTLRIGLTWQFFN